MKVQLVTFADESMSRAAQLCMESGVAHGADFCVPSTRSWLETTEVYQANLALFAKPRGVGYWVWKPLLIDLMLREVLNDGDILIYADAGIEFIDNVKYIIDRMDQDVFLFGNNWEHAHWCKRDIIDTVWPFPIISDNPQDEAMIPWMRFGKQVQASVIFFRVSDYTRSFVAEWLKWCLHRQRFTEGVCTDEWRYLIDDSPSIAPNHPEFQENRHDQAILTTMAYREGIRIHYWPASYNDGAFNYEKLPEYASDDYPILFNHHRRRNHEWENAA